ncbi:MULTISPECIES: peptidoglycan D,D-transpeptidase FtsI family protein [Streptomyces]|uniref:Peptidoglycan glycosyltransferase n=1 Tax=Streptomyces clavifer TaxID=68188 RepID=A0ABS4V5B7_9ACTN|nr:MULTISPECIES: penicillin-binding transpeptidase domain-containing protein [Streptomyces]MBP2359091.1 peptidoglycan glycosyltransferase [Streptomyces clavifer]MDX2745767.1 penicillin-binding transpeptidase domain-containing protein [Streptomyces sp. NRRL_B-2557]WUC29928.1 penicillin-binding transpeptidase domain-containing protein [Streptomyces clavifer]GHA82595.1 penicillin-binding protein [Streptomyces clavifer]
MIPYIRRAAAFCLLLLVALLANAARVQLFEADELNSSSANRRTTIDRYDQPRGDILVDGKSVTGSKDTGEQLAYERTYRHGPLYAPVTGYASQTYGTTLLENAEDAILSGTAPILAPLPLWGDITRSRQPGGDVVTTVEDSMQRAAYDGLAGRRGAVAALDPATGKILALVSSPSYDPEVLSGTGSSVTDAWARLNGAAGLPMLNRAIRQTYPPGSAFKIVTAAAALDARVVTDPDAATDTPSPYLLPGTSTTLPNEARGCGKASLAEAIRVSCNTVMAHLGVEVGLEGMLKAVGRFGFNDDDLRIPSGVARSNFDSDMSDDQLALSSIGQYDTTATPLQMAMVASAVANGGDLSRPHLVNRVTTADGDTVRQRGAETYHRAMNPATAMQLRRMMVDVVENGTGTNAAIDGVTVGGKTGTAQHGVDNSGTPYAWFISWAQEPGSGRPAVAVAVVVEDASANRADISGGGSAAPIARAVMEAALKSRG